MKVSVIVPVYNAGKYLKRCLDSIKAQNFEDFEVILVDDGSTDNSNEICAEYCVNDKRFRVVVQDNSGPDIARKTGVSQAIGDYIMFVDADDYVSADIINTMYTNALEYEADLVCSQIWRFNNSGKLWPGSNAVEYITCIDNTAGMIRAYFESGLLVGTYYAKLILRKLIFDYGFVENSIIGEDISAALYLFQKAKKVCIIPDKNYYYFWNSESISHSGYTSRHAESLANYIRVRDSLLDKEYVDKRFICGYFAEYEMAVATAMSRNKCFNEETASKLKDDIKAYWNHIKQNEKTPLYMKICMLIYKISPKLFIRLYRAVYLVTGR
jgi:glycosyltransferase involved in cell wall biosynthesis